VYSTAANWSATSGGAPGGVKPAAGDDVYFDGNGDNNCTLDEATAAINSLSVHSAIDAGGIYSATLDFNDFAVNVTGGGDMTFDGSGTVDCGTGTLTCSGNFDSEHQTTWVQGTATLVMNGAGKTISGSSANETYNLTIDANITLSVGVSRWEVENILLVNAGNTFTIAAGFRLVSATTTVHGTISVSTGYLCSLIGGSISVEVGGSVTGAGTVSFATGSVSKQSGTWDVASTNPARNVTLATGIYGGTWTCTGGDDAAITFKFGGDVEFLGDVSFNSDNAAGTYTVDLDSGGADVDVIFNGDLTISETGGAGDLTWTKSTGTGTVTFDGTTTFDDSTGADIGDVTVSDGSSLELATAMTCDDLTVGEGCAVTGAF